MTAPLDPIQAEYFRKLRKLGGDEMTAEAAATVVTDTTDDELLVLARHWSVWPIIGTMMVPSVDAVGLARAYIALIERHRAEVGALGDQLADAEITMVNMGSDMAELRAEGERLTRERDGAREELAEVCACCLDKTGQRITRECGHHKAQREAAESALAAERKRAGELSEAAEAISSLCGDVIERTAWDRAVLRLRAALGRRAG